MSTTNIITTTFVTQPISTTINIDDDNVIWEDPDLDFVIVEPKTTTIPIASTSFHFPKEFPADTDASDESSTIPPQSVEHFDFIDNIPASSTIRGGMEVAEHGSRFNWWDLKEASYSPLTESINSLLTTTTITTTNTFTLIPSTIKSTTIDEDEWAIFNTTSIPLITQLNQLPDTNSDIDVDMNDYFLVSTLSTTPTIYLINNTTPPFVPYYFTDYKPKDQLFDLMKPAPTFAMPPFSWMLHLANQNENELKNRQTLINKTLTTTTINTNMNKKKRIDSKPILSHDIDQFYEYCNRKQCQYGGRLNPDCLCICLPAYSGDNCETGKTISF